MKSSHPCLLLLLPSLALGCTGDEEPGAKFVEVSGDHEQVVGVPFELSATVKRLSGPTELEVTLSSGNAIAEPPPGIALRTIEAAGGEIPIPLVCQNVGEGLVIVSLRRPGRPLRFDSTDFEVSCILGGDTGSGATDTDPTSGPATDPTVDPTADPTTGGSLPDMGDAEETGTDTDEPIEDAEFLAIDYTERMYALILGVNPTVFPGAQLMVPATDLRVETLEGERFVIGNYELPDDLGIVHGRYTPGFDEVEPLAIPEATLLVDNAFNGVEFVIGGSSLWLFDGVSVVETEPTAVLSLACEGMSCVAAATDGGFLRSADGGQNWTPTPADRFVSALEVGDGRFVGWDHFNLEMVTSDDGGTTWTGSAFPAPLGPLTLGYGGGRFVAPAAPDIYSSSDGVTWEVGTQPFQFGLSDIAYSPTSGEWAGFTGGDMAFATSEDGAVWTAAKGVQGKTIFRSIAGL